MVDNDRLAEESMDDGLDRSGKLWDASRNLKEGKDYSCEITPVLQTHLDNLVHAGKLKKKVMDYVEVFFVEQGDILSLLPASVRQAALLHYRNILYEYPDWDNFVG